MNERIDLYRISFPLFRRHYTREADAMERELGFEAVHSRPQGVSQWSCARTLTAAVDLIDRVVAVHERFSEGAPLTYERGADGIVEQNLWRGDERLDLRWTMNTKWSVDGPLVRRVEPFTGGCDVQFFRPLRYDCPFLGGGTCEERWTVTVVTDRLNLWCD